VQMKTDQNGNVPMKLFLLIAVLLAAIVGRAQLAVKIESLKVTGQKAILSLEMKNKFPAEKIESARAVAFLIDSRGKVVGQATRWVIGESKDRSGLLAGGTTTYNFVVTSQEPFKTTNLTARVQFARVVLEGGKLADVTQNVEIRSENEK